MPSRCSKPLKTQWTDGSRRLTIFVCWISFAPGIAKVQTWHVRACPGRALHDHILCFGSTWCTIDLSVTTRQRSVNRIIYVEKVCTAMTPVPIHDFPTKNLNLVHGSWIALESGSTAVYTRVRNSRFEASIQDSKQIYCLNLVSAISIRNRYENRLFAGAASRSCSCRSARTEPKITALGSNLTDLRNVEVDATTYEQL